ncbi:MAG: hypothetical protein SO170_06220 [Butyribacter sp.]|nr:hypothetical protein [bacterium]MDY3854528.1 hypothetical protein [Butyribacter sp.]
MKQTKQLLKELMLGLLCWAVLIAIILMVIGTHRLALLAGVVVGILTAAGVLWHMYYHLDIALDMDTKHAQSHTQLSAIKRTLIMGVVIAVSLLYPQYIHPVGTVLGIFGIKITALLYPALHRLLQKRKTK